MREAIRLAVARARTAWLLAVPVATVECGCGFRATVRRVRTAVRLMRVPSGDRPGRPETGEAREPMRIVKPR